MRWKCAYGERRDWPIEAESWKWLEGFRDVNTEGLKHRVTMSGPGSPRGLWVGSSWYSWVTPDALPPDLTLPFGSIHSTALTLLAQAHLGFCAPDSCWPSRHSDLPFSRSVITTATEVCPFPEWAHQAPPSTAQCQQLATLGCFQPAPTCLALRLLYRLLEFQFSCL